MKTAVEWYNSKVIELMTQREQGNIDVLEFRNQLDLLLEQAKGMEESVTKTAYEVGIARGMSYDEEIYHKNNWWSSEQYYNETFKSE
jgi:hypothetical protein